MADSHDRNPNKRLDPVTEQLSCARVLGYSVLLEPLQDRTSWNQSATAVQDLAIQAAAEILKPDFQWLQTQTYICEEYCHRIASFKHLELDFNFSLLPGGDFLIGEEQLPDRGFIPPPFKVSIPPFLISQTLVTRDVWQRQSKNQESNKEEDEDDNSTALSPLNMVSWLEFSEWLEQVPGGLRFPSESEWEYACRAGSQEFWCFGSDVSLFEQYGYVSDGFDNPLRQLAQLKPNSFGLYDMHGGLMEFCEDVWIASYEVLPIRHQPRYRYPFGHRVTRSGFSHLNDPWRCVSAERYYCGILNSRENHGFRLAKSLTELQNRMPIQQLKKFRSKELSFFALLESQSIDPREIFEVSNKLRELNPDNTDEKP